MPTPRALAQEIFGTRPKKSITAITFENENPLNTIRTHQYCSASIAAPLAQHSYWQWRISSQRQIPASIIDS